MSVILQYQNLDQDVVRYPGDQQRKEMAQIDVEREIYAPRGISSNRSIDKLRA